MGQNTSKIARKLPTNPTIKPSAIPISNTINSSPNPTQSIPPSSSVNPPNEPDIHTIKNENVILNLSKFEIKEFKQNFKNLQKTTVNMEIDEKSIEKYYEKL
jgi:hypothetical protein